MADRQLAFHEPAAQLVCMSNQTEGKSSIRAALRRARAVEAEWEERNDVSKKSLCTAGERFSLLSSESWAGWRVNESLPLNSKRQAPKKDKDQDIDREQFMSKSPGAAKSASESRLPTVRAKTKLQTLKINTTTGKVTLQVASGPVKSVPPRTDQQQELRDLLKWHSRKKKWLTNHSAVSNLMQQEIVQEGEEREKSDERDRQWKMMLTNYKEQQDARDQSIWNKTHPTLHQKAMPFEDEYDLQRRRRQWKRIPMQRKKKNKGLANSNANINVQSNTQPQPMEMQISVSSPSFSKPSTAPSPVFPVSPPKKLPWLKKPSTSPSPIAMSSQFSKCIVQSAVGFVDTSIEPLDGPKTAAFLLSPIAQNAKSGQNKKSI